MFALYHAIRTLFILADQLETAVNRLTTAEPANPMPNAERAQRVNDLLAQYKVQA